MHSENQKSKVATPCEATTLHPIMSALHKLTNLPRALGNLGEGAEGATGDHPKTWPDSSLLHPTQCRKNPPKGSESPPPHHSWLRAKSTSLIVKEDSNPALISSPSQSMGSHRAGHLQGILARQEIVFGEG